MIVGEAGIAWLAAESGARMDRASGQESDLKLTLRRRRTSLVRVSWEEVFLQGWELRGGGGGRLTANSDDEVEQDRLVGEPALRRVNSSCCSSASRFGLICNEDPATTCVETEHSVCAISVGIVGVSGKKSPAQDASATNECISILLPGQQLGM